MRKVKKLCNCLFTTLYGVQGGPLSKRGNRNFSGVGVPFICNFPDELFETRVNSGKKFTFVISEHNETMLMRWFIGIKIKLMNKTASKPRIIVFLSFGLSDLLKHLVRSLSREQVRLIS